MTPNKCPKCGAGIYERSHRQAAMYQCGTRYIPPRGRIVKDWHESPCCLIRQRDQLLARVKQLEEEADYWRQTVANINTAAEARAEMEGK